MSATNKLASEVLHKIYDDEKLQRILAEIDNEDELLAPAQRRRVRLCDVAYTLSSEKLRNKVGTMIAVSNILDGSHSGPEPHYTVLLDEPVVDLEHPGKLFEYDWVPSGGFVFIETIQEAWARAEEVKRKRQSFMNSLMPKQPDM